MNISRCRPRFSNMNNISITKYVALQRETGLQSDDFALYRRYLGKRLRKLREKLGCTRQSKKEQGSIKEIHAEAVHSNHEYEKGLIGMSNEEVLMYL